MTDRRRLDSLIPRITALLLAALAALDVLLAIQLISGAVPWDVKGHLLEGVELSLFSFIVGMVGILGILTSVLIWQGRQAGRLGAVAFWLVVGLVAGATDRRFEGVGEPLWFYVALGTGPAAVTTMLLWFPKASRRFFSA